MTGSTGTTLGAVMILAGFGIPVMAALNGGLGLRLGNPVLAATWLFALALTISVVLLLLQPAPVTVRLFTVPPYYFLGGLFVAFYVLSITFIAPKMGVGNAIVLVLLGQMAASALIDHNGWLNAPQTPFSIKRFAGLLAMATGVWLMRRPMDCQ